MPPQFVWRTRRRWLRWAVPTTVALSVLAICMAGSQAQSPLAGSVPAVLASSVEARPRLGAVRPAEPLQAREVDAVGGGELIVANFQGIYKTTDMGHHWTDITPPFVPSPVILTHLFHVVSYGNERIWLDLTGDERFVFVPYSWDGGRTWKTSTFPRSAVLTGSAPSFSTAEDGWLVAQPSASTSASLYRTTDGGATWAMVAKSAKVPFGDPMTWANSHDGWALGDAGNNPAAQLGSALYRSTDGGADWHLVHLPGIPGYRGFGVTVALPVFFGEQDGVMAGRLARASHGRQPVVVYVTSDGGKTWKARLVPSSAATASYPQGSFSVPFSASRFGLGNVRRFDRVLDPRRRRALDQPRRKPPSGHEHRQHLLVSAALGWAQAMGPEWTYLLRTTNSGRNWTTVSM